MSVSPTRAVFSAIKSSEKPDISRANVRKSNGKLKNIYIKDIVVIICGHEYHNTRVVDALIRTHFLV